MIGDKLKDDLELDRLDFVYHDECCAHTKDFRKMQWRCTVSGTMQQKDKGIPRMVSGFTSDRDGFYHRSSQFINPGKNRDGYWDGNDLINQIPKFLHDFDEKSLFLGGSRKTKCCIVFDNSTGHSCLPADALRTGAENPLNATPGGVTRTIMRNGSYVDKDGFQVSQSYFLKVGYGRKNGHSRYYPARWESGKKEKIRCNNSTL